MVEGNDFNIEDYKPITDTTLLSDDEIELWYGSKFAVDFLRLIEGCKIENDSGAFFHNIKYNDLFKYYVVDQLIVIDFNKIYLPLKLKYDVDINKSIYNILINHFKYNISKVIHNNFTITGF